MNDPHPPDPRPRSLLASLGLSQVASALATGIDLVVLVALTELAGLHYAASTAVGAAVGAVTNFLLGRYWVFLAAQGHMGRQLTRYVLVVASSVAWNSALVYALTEGTGLAYPISRLVAAVVVAVLHNFPLLRWVVFRDGTRAR